MILIDFVCEMLVWIKKNILFVEKILKYLTHFLSEATLNYQEGRRQWAVYYTSPQSFLYRFLIRWPSNFWDLVNFDWLFF